MNIYQKLLSGLLVSSLISVGGGMALKAIANETKTVIPTSTQDNIDEYKSTCAAWSGEVSEFSRRHTTGYGWFDFSDFRWTGKPVKEIDFWYMCTRNIFQSEAGEDALGRDLEEECDRIGENFHRNWVYFPQLTTVNHEFSAETVEGKMPYKQFAVYSCRIVVQPNNGTSDASE